MGFASSGVPTEAFTDFFILQHPELTLSSIPDLTAIIFTAAGFVENNMTDAANITDGNTGTVATTTLNEYGIMDLGAYYKISQYRHGGHGDMVGNGEFKIAILTANGWVDWATFATRNTSVLTGWISVPDEAYARWIRLKCSVVDTWTYNLISGLEIKL